MNVSLLVLAGIAIMVIVALGVRSMPTFSLDLSFADVKELGAPHVYLSWPIHPKAEMYEVWRRKKGRLEFEMVSLNISGSDKSNLPNWYQDFDVESKSVYEYKVRALWKREWGEEYWYDHRVSKVKRIYVTFAENGERVLHSKTK